MSSLDARLTGLSDRVKAGGKVHSRTRSRATSLVAQVGNLLFRRLAVGKVTTCRWPICDIPAGRDQSALRENGFVLPHNRALVLTALLLVALSAAAQPVFQIVAVNSPQPWRRAEFRILGVPAVSNPFDPEVVRVDALFTAPSGQKMSVPAFWYQDYQRNLSGSTETLSPVGVAEWRLRYTPAEAGTYGLTLTVLTNGQPCGSPSVTNFTATGTPPPVTGYVRADPLSHQHFETGDGQPLRLVGENVCWPGSRGTFDYDDWFAAMQADGQNYARLWMCPWFFGIETSPNSLNRYELDRAWQLDYVLKLAEERGIYVELCLDYHGMFATEPDYWGGNNYWSANPYCITNGGPCIDPDAFFTNPTARTLYQKRLRYLIARYGYSPNLLSWQFFNEIDNVYSLLNPSDVTAWHRVMGEWMHANDPYGHLLTTSFTYADKHPEIWSLPEMDYACIHAYGPNAPATYFSTMAQAFLRQYGKPVLIDEFGTDWHGWNRSTDPYLRGFRQGLWGGALGGSVGTAMSWWWQNIHDEDVYPVFTALKSVLSRTGWGRGSWTNIDFDYSAAPPATVGDPLPGGQPFTVTLPLDHGWGSMLSGRLAVANPEAAGYSPGTLNSFVHGTTHADLRIPFQLSAWLTNGARLVMHVNSVSWNPVLVVRADATELFHTNLPNLDGGYSVTNEYNLDIPVNLPPGKHLIEISNAGNDWFYLDWVRLEQVLPAAYADNWSSPPQPIGLRGPHESLVYVVAPGAAFPAGATNVSLPQQVDQTVTMTNWPPGLYYAEWYDPASATLVGRSQATCTNQQLVLPLPVFSEDLAGVVFPPPALTPLGRDQAGAFHFQLDSETGGQYEIWQSTNLVNWSTFLPVTNTSGTLNLTAPGPSTSTPSFFRAVRVGDPQ